MRYLDADEAKRLNAEQWQLDLLKCNPEYCSWGPHEDYMSSKGEGWNSPLIHATWADFGPFELDDLNECANFYFEVTRANKECETCKGNGYHEKAQQIANTFYRHMCADVGLPESVAWHDKITQDECDALIESGRVKEGMTAQQVNAGQHSRARGFFSHDAINRCILIEARLKRLGLPKTCETCDGHGYVFTAEKANVSLVLWWLHPRKGCSRGIEVTTIDRSDLPFVKEFLQAAAKRNAERFSGVSLIE
jgi:hypothetical protein